MVTIDRIRAVLAEGGWLQIDPNELDAEVDLYDAGLSSHDSVNLMLSLEETFDVEFPDAMLRRKTFATMGAIAAALAQLRGEAVAS